MLVVKKVDKNQVHTFNMPKVEKKGKQWVPVVKDDKPVMEPQTFYEIDKDVNGLAIVARALAENGSHVLIYIKDKEKKETK